MEANRLGASMFVEIAMVVLVIPSFIKGGDIAIMAS
jgi:hypothetical protein